jgi:hypothetical protein
VGQPIDLNTGYDLLHPEGQAAVWDIIERQKPKVILMAPPCTPWSQMQNINDPRLVARKQHLQLPILTLGRDIAEYQSIHGRYFSIENPSTSKIWNTPEFQHIVTETYSMNNEDWRRMSKFSLTTMLMHSMKAGVFILAYMNKHLGVSYAEIIQRIIKSEEPFLKSIMDFFDQYSLDVLSGQGRGLIYEKYSDVYLDPEEVALLKVSENKKLFFGEIIKTLEQLIPKHSMEEFINVVRFQSYLVPEFLSEESILEVNFNNNIPEYCYSTFNNLEIKIINTPTTLLIYQEKFSNHQEFAKKKIIWSRKSGTILWATNYERELKEKMRVSFDISDYTNEKTFNLSMIHEKINKFEKFSSLKNIDIKKA